MTPARWALLMQRLGLAENLQMFRQIEAAYSEPHRHYHTGAHIDACLREFDAVRSLAEFEDEVEVALWFHDVVYVPQASDNEQRSAGMAAGFLASTGSAPSVCARVHALVMATVHDAEPAEPDARLLVDVDLSILGQDRNTYDQFERAIREEYKRVPRSLYCQKRGEILASFMAREFIYRTEPFRARYELTARANLGRAIKGLGK
jgi:predicted metal-dependent HD superfamily phosphohydrolase